MVWNLPFLSKPRTLRLREAKQDTRGHPVFVAELVTCFCTIPPSIGSRERAVCLPPLGISVWHTGSQCRRVEQYNQQHLNPTCSIVLQTREVKK